MPNNRPEDDATDAWKTTHHRTSVRTGFLLFMYLLVVGLLALNGFSFWLYPDASRGDKVTTLVVFGLLSLAFLVIAYVTVRDRRADVDANKPTDDNEIQRREKF